MRLYVSPLPFETALSGSFLGTSHARSAELDEDMDPMRVLLIDHQSTQCKTFNEGLESVGYFMPLLKTVELLCGLAFVVGRFVPLATILIAPIIVNIFCFHAFVDRTGLPVAIFLVLANGFVAYYYKKSYAEVLKAK